MLRAKGRESKRLQTAGACFSIASRAVEHRRCSSCKQLLRNIKLQR